MILNLHKATSPQERQATARLDARHALEEVAICYGNLMVALASGFGEGSAYLGVYDLDQQLIEVSQAAARARERLRPLMIVREAA